MYFYFVPGVGLLLATGWAFKIFVLVLEDGLPIGANVSPSCSTDSSSSSVKNNFDPCLFWFTNSNNNNINDINEKNNNNNKINVQKTLFILAF